MALIIQECGNGVTLEARRAEVRGAVALKKNMNPASFRRSARSWMAG